MASVDFSVEQGTIFLCIIDIGTDADSWLYVVAADLSISPPFPHIQLNQTYIYVLGNHDTADLDRNELGTIGMVLTKMQ